MNKVFIYDREMNIQRCYGTEYQGMIVQYIDHMGDDNSVVNSARVSFAKEASNFTDEQNHRLICYLAKHKHEIPFAHTAITLRMKAPIAIRTQCFKHKVGFVENEVSRRYVSDTPELFIPDFWRTKPIGNVKQGSGTSKVDINTEFKKGFCINCGSKFPIVQTGRDKKYCSVECKTQFTNRNRNPYKTVFQNCKARVERESVRKWELAFDTFEFPEYCKYLGIKLDYSYGKGGICDNSPSFDRIDSSKDYTPDNVQVISHKANTMKSSANNDELVMFAKNVLLMHGGYTTCGSSYEQICNEMIDLYKAMIKADISPEQARFVLPQGVMTEWVWTGSLLAFARFYNLRTDTHAQKEIQDLAHMVGEIIEPLYPVSWNALTGN